MRKSTEKKIFFTIASARTVRWYQLAMPDIHYLHYEIINICKKKYNKLQNEICGGICNSVLHCWPTTSESKKRTMTHRHRMLTIRAHITNFAERKNKRKKPLLSEKRTNKVLFVYSKQVKAEKRGAPTFLFFSLPSDNYIIFTCKHLHALTGQTNQTNKNMLHDVFMYIMNTQNVHAHIHTQLQNFRVFCLFTLSVLTFTLAPSTTVGKLWYKNETRTCTHACTQLSVFGPPLFKNLCTHVHARAHYIFTLSSSFTFFFHLSHF